MIRRITDYFRDHKNPIAGCRASNRRNLLKYSGLVLGGAALTGCAERSAPTERKDGLQKWHKTVARWKIDWRLES